MPLFFVGYTVLVWAFAIRHRRTMTVLIPLIGGIGGLMLINVAHYYISVATDGAIDLPMVQTLMYPYTLLVALGGAFLALLPRAHKLGCVKCGYDLAGLDIERSPDPRCPECGTLQPIRNRYRPSGVDPDDYNELDNPEPPAPRPDSTDDQPHHRPQHQHAHRHPAQQDPPQQAQITR